MIALLLCNFVPIQNIMAYSTFKFFESHTNSDSEWENGNFIQQNSRRINLMALCSVIRGLGTETRTQIKKI
jgi:hypothetical protein